MKSRRIVSLLLCLCLVIGLVPSAFADGEEGESMSIIRDEEIQTIITDYLSSKGIAPERVGIGFCYTATGDEWYMNGDEWMYAASLYKLPLMMLLSERVQSGELSQDSNIAGLSVDTIEEYILVYSNNDWAHTIRAYLGGDEVWRGEAKKYSAIADEDYAADYLPYCYFSPRYVTDCLKTLYFESERFPKITEYMKQAEPGKYLRTEMEGQYPIAQKYGSYIEPNQTWNNHAAGIVFSDNPVIITVMTKNVDNYNAVIGHLAKLLTDYGLTLDARKAQFEQEKLAAQLAEEEAARAAEEAAIRAAEEENRHDAAEAERIANERLEAQKAEAKAERREEASAPMAVAVIAFLAAVAAVAVLVIFGKKGFPAKKREDDFDDLDDDDLDDLDDDDLDDLDDDLGGLDDAPKKRPFGDRLSFLAAAMGKPAPEKEEKKPVYVSAAAEPTVAVQKAPAARRVRGATVEPSENKKKKQLLAAAQRKRGKHEL